MFEGMRVRLGGKLSAKRKLVHDAVGSVLSVAFARGEVDGAGARARRLRQLPRGVFVRFDGFTEDLGAGPGVVLVRPVQNKWKYNAHVVVGGERVQREVKMLRTQIPLAPEKERTVQTAQGMTMDAAKIFLARPGTMGYEDCGCISTSC